MEFHYTTLETCSTADGVVVVVDVLRAFTTAAFALAGGAARIIPVGTIEQALEYKRLNPEALVIGEVKGLPPPGFDYGNSPTRLLESDLRGRTLVHRTGAGTQGVVRSTSAETMFAASFVVAAATVRSLKALAPDKITFVVTGLLGNLGSEDLACARYLEACLKGLNPDPAPYLAEVPRTPEARIFFNPARPEFPESDITYCTDLDRFAFAMPVRRENGLHIIERSP